MATKRKLFEDVGDTGTTRPVAAKGGIDAGRKGARGARDRARQVGRGDDEQGREQHRGDEDDLGHALHLALDLPHVLAHPGGRGSTEHVGGEGSFQRR